MEQSISFTKDDVKVIIDIIELLMENKAFIRKFAPDFIIPVNKSEVFVENFKITAEKLIPILSRLGILNLGDIKIQKSSITKQKKEKTHKKSNDFDEKVVNSFSELMDLIQEKIIIVSSNSYKKKLKTRGINPQVIKSVGGPLNIDDYERIGKSLTSKALEGIEKKIKNFTLEITNLAQEGKLVSFLYSSDNITDNLNLNRLEELEKEIKIKIEIINIDSLKFL